MNHEQRAMQASQQDPAAAAAIIKSIAEIERDYRMAEGPLSELMMIGVEAAMRKSAPEPWIVTKTEASALLSFPEWKPTKGLGNGDAWFEISEITDDEGDEQTWVSVAVGAGPSKFGLELMFRRALAAAADAVTREQPQAQKLTKIGFVRDALTQRLFVPIEVDRLRLAKGFQENDLTEALAPVGKAVEAVVKAKSDLDALIEQVRTRAKSR
jgi:hypothetical protein